MPNSAVTVLPDVRSLAAARYQQAVSDIPEVLELAAEACQAPMAALKIVGGVGAHFAATLGLTETVPVPKSISFTNMVAAQDHVMIVDDAGRDPRTADHPLVAGSAHVSFIAAAPLHHDGHIVGALCVFDNNPRTLGGAATRRMLERIARRIDAETGLRDLMVNSPFALGGNQDEAVTSISHEIRTPLASIQGNLELLTEMPGAIDPRYARQIDAITRNAERLTRTVDNLLRAVNQQMHEPSGERRAVDLTALVTRIAAGLNDQTGRLLLDLPYGPVLALADERLLTVAVDHLLSNALSFGCPKNPVVVTIAERPHPTIQVRDHGPGLSEAELARLGTPFFRGEDARINQAPGLGLGLTISRRIVEAQGGNLVLDSKPGAGLTARVVLPTGTVSL